MEHLKLKDYCRWYLLGKCRFGSRCHYLHKKLPYNLCKYYLFTGNCKQGDKCSFVHSVPNKNPNNPNPMEERKDEKFQTDSKCDKQEEKKEAEEKKIFLVAATKPTTRTLFTKQGNKQEEKEIFECNRKEWEKFPSYLEYLKSLKNDQDQDIAQILRRYQYSFRRKTSPAEGITSFYIRHTYFLLL